MASGAVIATQRVVPQGVATTAMKGVVPARRAIRMRAVKADAKVDAAAVAAAVDAVAVAKARVKTKATASVLMLKASPKVQTSACKLRVCKMRAAMNNAPNVLPVASVLSVTTAATAATAHRATASAARTPSARRRCEVTQQLPLTPQRKPQKATTSREKTDAKADVRVVAKAVEVAVDVDAALSVAHARTKTVKRWTTRKRPWALLNPPMM
jgi:hypothetical protein